MIDGIEQTGRDGIVRALEIVEGGVERQSGAHPKEHAGAKTIARCPEVVFAVTYSLDWPTKNSPQFNQFAKKNL